MSWTVQKRKSFIVIFLLAMTFCNFTLLSKMVPKLRNGYQDFTIFYTGARLLRDGRASVLYDGNTQYQLQQTFTDVPIRLGPLPFNHPPFEALLFVPFTLLAYWPAYLVWTSLNLIMLGVCLALLRAHVPQLAAVSPWLLGLAAIAFLPLAMALFQGQDVILLQLLFVLTMICLDRGKDAAAGALLAAGLFRPHTVVPLVLLLGIRRWRMFLGFVPVALALVALSVAIIGWHGPIDYVRFVLHIDGTHVFGPEAAPNLHGLIVSLPGVTLSGPWSAALVFTASLAVFFAALRRIRDGRDSILFSSSLAAVTTILVSFHAFVYDLTLLLPTVLFVVFGFASSVARKINARTMLLVFLLFLTPLYVYLLMVAGRFFWFSLILLWLYVRLLLSPAPAEVPA